jgi:hypothetical protein
LDKNKEGSKIGFAAILPDFSHDGIDKSFQMMLEKLPPLVEPRGFLTMFALINRDLASLTIRWYGLAEGINLNNIGRKYLVNKNPLPKNIKNCGLIWKVLEKETGTSVTGLRRQSLGYYRVKKPLEGSFKDYFVPVTTQETRDTFLVPIYNLERNKLIGVFAVDSDRENVFGFNSAPLRTLVSFVNFLENVVNSIHIAYYDYLCMDLGVFNRNYLQHVLRAIV